MMIDLVPEVVSRADAAVVPGLDDALAPQGIELPLQLVAERLVGMGISEEYFRGQCRLRESPYNPLAFTRFR